MSRFTLLLLSLVLPGCAGVAGVKPVVQVEIREPSGLEIETTGKGREILVRVPFQGGLETCGMQKDSFYLDVGTIRCSGDPGAALSDLLVKELRKAGFRVQTGEIPAKSTTVQIGGELFQFYSEPVSKGGNETDIHLQLTARSGTGLDAERAYYEKGHGGDAQRSVNSAVRKTLQSLVDGIVELMDNYPMLGVASLSAIKDPANPEQNR